MGRFFGVWLDLETRKTDLGLVFPLDFAVLGWLRNRFKGTGVNFCL